MHVHMCVCMYACMYMRIYVQRRIQRFKGGCTIKYNDSRFYLDFAKGLQVTSKVTLVGMRGTTMLGGLVACPAEKFMPQDGISSIF